MKNIILESFNQFDNKWMDLYIMVLFKLKQT